MTILYPLVLEMQAKLFCNEVQTAKACHLEVIRAFREILWFHVLTRHTVTEEILDGKWCKWEHVVISIQEIVAKSWNAMQKHLYSTTIKRRQGI